VGRSGAQRLLDGGLQPGRAVAIEQAQQRAGESTDIGAALGGTGEQQLAGRHSPGQGIDAAVLSGLTFELHERLQVVWVLDLRVAVVTAAMAGDHLGAIEDPDLVDVGAYGQRAAHAGVRDGVVVEIEADIGRLADLYG